MLKRKTIPISASKGIDFKCGDCIAFRRVAKFEKPCVQLEVKAFADAPSCFTADPYILSKKNPDALYQLGVLFSDWTPQQRRVFMALLKQTNVSNKIYKLIFGQPVYFYLARDYLSNYFRGFVVGVAPRGEDQVYVTSDLRGLQRRSPIFASLTRENVFTTKEFKKKKDQLIKTGKLRDEKLLSDEYEITAPLDETYVPPSMETAPPEWFDKYDRRLSSKTSLKKTADGSLEFKVV